MRIPRVRFTIRLGMALIAIVAIFTASAVIVRRRARYREQAAWHAAEEAKFAAVVRLIGQPQRKHLTFDHPLGNYTRPRSSSGLVTKAEIEKAVAEVFIAEQLLVRNPDLRARYHASMKVKYKVASARPWQFVSPDPPEPE